MRFCLFSSFLPNLARRYTSWHYGKPREGTAATQSVCIRKGGERFQIFADEAVAPYR